MDELNTADNILDWMKTQAAEKVPISPARWLEASIKLEILSSDETDKLIDLETAVAKIRLTALDETGAAAKAKIIIEASDPYNQLRKQKKKCDRIDEMVRLSKKFAQLKSDELRSAV